MDTLTRYRQILQDLIIRFSRYAPADTQREWLPICDPVRDEYLLLKLGWDEEGRRVNQPIFHFRLVGGKVYVEEDNTDADIVGQMLKAGIAQEDIVLAFYPPAHRHFTDFASA